ncbi:MAG: GNAT family N-acetyltransferase [Gaiellales bacterium]
MIHVREATPGDWPAMWQIMRPVIAAGDTFCWDPQLPERDARARWCHEPPGRTFVAVDEQDAVLGTAESHPNYEGPGAHVANAGFMVAAGGQGRGVGRALCEHVLEQARSDGFRAMQFNAVAESNLRAVALWEALGFRVLATVPEAFRHPTAGYVGLHIMYRRL